MKNATALVLVAYLLKEAFEYFVQYLNLRYMKKFRLQVPPEFKAVMDEAILGKTQ